MVAFRKLISSGCRRQAIRITTIERRSVGDSVEISAQILSLPNHPDFRLWFRFPAAVADGQSTNGDAFLAALLPMAVQCGLPLAIDGAVSERLLAGCQQIMRIWHAWDPSDMPVRVVANEVRKAACPAAENAAFFSLGLDSFYTVLKNLNHEKGDGRIQNLIFVHGFDIPIDNHQLFAKVLGHAQETADQLGLRLIVVSTNTRLLTDRFSDWPKHQFGASMGSVGLCLQGLLKRALIAASLTYADQSPGGSHPLVDPLWSTESLEFFHDGAEASRPQKTLWQIACSNVALNHLRACWGKYNETYNCNRCEKCFRTMLNLHAAGVLDRCKTFAGVSVLKESLELMDAKGFRLADPHAHLYMRENLEALEQTGRYDDMQRHLRQILARGVAPRLWNRQTMKDTVKYIDGQYLRGITRRLYHQLRY